MNTLVASEFAYDNLADKCSNLDPNSAKYKNNNCDEHKIYSPQTDLIRNTVGARTILVLNELDDKKKKAQIKEFITIAGICTWIPEDFRKKNDVTCESGFK